jgi:anti-sigma-K factor RskA
MTHSREELFELAAAYALGATTPDEAAAIEAALPESPELAAEVASFREVAAEMAFLAPVVPSPDTRSRLLGRIQLERQTAPADTRGGGSAPRWTTRNRYLAAAAGILVVASLGAESLLLAKRARDAEQKWIAAANKLEQREQTLNAMFHAEKDLRLIHLKAADTVKGPGIQVFWNEKHQAGVVHAFRLPPAPANHAYQVWAIVDGRPASVNVFNSDPDGHALVRDVPMPASSRGVTMIAVTVEPAGGSPAPTTEPFLKGAVPGTY